LVENVAFWAYTAGLMDGEGCILLFMPPHDNTYKNRGRGKTLRVKITTSPKILRWIQVELHKRNINSVIRRIYKKNAKELSMTTCGGYRYAYKECDNAAFRFLRKIRPYSILKAPQIDLVLNKLLPYWKSRTKINLAKMNRDEKIATIKFACLRDELHQLKERRRTTSYRHPANYWRKSLGFKVKK
jgi:hypothetical protein